MRNWISFFIVSLLLLAGCQSIGGKPHSEASWAYPMVKWNGEMYEITSEKVTQEELGEPFGEVTSYSDQEESSEAGNFSNSLKKGTKYYEIKGVSKEKAFAVKEKEGTYVKVKRADR